MKSLEEVSEPARGACRILRSQLDRAFGDDLAAIWLYGANVFGPYAVDVDLHVLLGREPSPEDGEAIKAAHETVDRENPGIDLDTWYVLLQDARSAERPANVGPWNPGIRDQHWALHRAHWLAGALVVVHGLRPEEVVPAPSWEEIEGELRRDAAEAARALPHGSPYWTLQLCRLLASLETRDPVRSKLDSGRWALERLPAECRPILMAAMRYYSGVPRPGDMDLIGREFRRFYETVRPLIDAA